MVSAIAMRVAKKLDARESIAAAKVIEAIHVVRSHRYTGESRYTFIVLLHSSLLIQVLRDHY